MQEEQASAIARRLGFSVVSAAQAGSSTADVQLYYSTHWQLGIPGKNTRLAADFEQRDILSRLQASTNRREKVVRAVLGKKLKPAETHVLDVTAGFGRDALLLAAAGCSLTLAERNPLLAFLLQQALESGAHSDETMLAQAVSRMSLLETDSVRLMQEWRGDAPQVIFLDPMFEGPKGSAAAKKNMAFLQAVLPAEEDSSNGAALLSSALALAGHRVVVKRAPGSPFLDLRQPGYSLESKAVRFDVYPV